ncbi:MAG: hypothetical protein KBS75_06980, partial [Bacteroidales bacterium]|nr:hypothetical protein [Candidatus Equimonas faecalis]
MKKIIALLWLTLLAVASTVNVQADEAFRKHRYDSWKVMALPENSIVFVGNSITDMHNWTEAFGNDPRIVNRGNSGGYSYEVLDNVESWVRFKPAKVFIKIGTNDLGTSYTEQSIAANIQKTVDIIRNESPNTKIYLQSILPAKDQAYKTLTTIQAANELIEAIATKTINCTYIDLYSELGGIRSGGSYSADNLHLKAYGYKIWCEAILPYLNEGNTGATFSCVYPSNTETVQNMGGLGGSNGMRATYFSVQPITSNDILFFGDEMVKNGEWNELLKNANVKNRGTGWGYGGDIATTSGLVDATFASVSGVSKATPSKILLYTGTGDVNGNTALNTVESNYQALITKLQQKAPGTPIYLVSLMPRSSANQRIIDFNTWLQSKANGSSIFYIDIYTALASSGKANGNYFSGDYIYGMGYVKVAQELAKHIDGCTTLTDAQAAANKQVFEARTALNTAVNKAKSLRIGTGIGEYPQSVETTLASAITTAYAVLANTDATEANLTSATNTFNTVLNAQLLNINKPTTNKNYTIKASFSSGAKGRNLVNYNGTLVARTYLPGGYSALWTYTGSGFKSASDPTKYLYVDGGFKLATSSHTLNINAGLTEGTVTIAEGTRNAAINKNGTVSGGQYTNQQYNENSGWTTDFVLEEVEGEIPAPEVSAPTFSPINLLDTQTGWYQIADYMNGSGTATSDPALLTAYADEVTVNGNKYPAGFSVKKTATSVDELVKTFVYVTKTGSNNNNTNNINLQTANGRYMTYDGTSSLTASQIYQIYFTGSQKTRIVMSSGSSGNDRHSWIPQTSNAVNYVGYVQGSYPSYQFSAVDLDVLNLKTYTVKAVGTAEDVQVTYNGTANYGLDKVYNNGVFFFGIDAYPTASDFTASVANATITVGDGVIYVDGVPGTKVFETPASGTPYRIPAVAQAKNGDLVFVSDYRYSKADIGMANNGKLDLRFRKKYADGHWGDIQTLQACIESPTFTAFGDPCIVCDQATGKIMVTSCCGNVSYPNGTHSNHQGWSRWYSEDNGEHWSSTYVDLSEQVMNQIDKRTGAKLASFFIGSGKISQSKTIKVGEYYRLYCASLTRVSPDGTGTGAQTMNYVWYSDDFGVTWHMLGDPDHNPINGGNEPKADELPDGSVLISSRTGGGRIYNIFHYTDTKAAKGYWGSQVNSNANNNGTYGADCNGEILVVPVTRASDNQKTYLLLQSIPAASDRRNVGIYYKELTDLSKYRTAAELAANNWTLFPISYTTSAYSTMCQMKNDHVAFFYEENEHNSGYDMVFKELSIERITGNAYTYGELSESEKNTYLTNGVDPYFSTHSYGDENIIALAAAYKTSPTTSNYDALNAAVQDYFNVNVAGEYIRLRNCQYNKYLNANGTGINSIEDGTGNGTLWYVEDNGEGGLKLKNVGTGTYMGNISQSAAVTLSADNTTTFEFEMLDNGHVVFKQQNGGNYQYGHIDASNKLVGWEKSAGATQWELIEVVEVPSSTLSLEPNSQVTVSELSALAITFKGSNAAKVKLNAEPTKQIAYLVKDEAPAQTKVQNGKFNAPRLKAAGEGAIEGTITKDTEVDGKFNINFGAATIDDGTYTLSIPSGTFYVENDENLDTPVPALAAKYTVGEETTPVDDINEVIAYGALNGNTWTAWKNGVELPAGISAITQAGDATKLRIIEKTYSFNEGDNLSVIFKWDGTSNKRTDIVGVDILGSDGTVRYSDYHYGYAGNPNSNNGYTIKDITSGIYTVRYIATDNQSQTTTGGTITNILWDVPVNGKVYTVNSDHMGVPYYLVAGTYEGFTAINGEATPMETSSKWLASGSDSEGYAFYNISTKENLHTNDGTKFDIKDARKLVGTTIVTHNTWNAQAATTQTLKGGRYGRSDEAGMKGILQNDKTSWSTDFVFNFTGEYAYKVQTEEGQTVTFNDVDFENGDFIIVDEQLTDATGLVASAKAGCKSEMAVDAANYTITVTYSNVTTVEVPYTLTPTDGATITSIDDLATITLQFTGKDVEEGLMPVTAEYMERDPVYPTLTKESTVITATSIAMNEETGAYYEITFPTAEITDGEWKLSIPEGAFYTMDYNTMSEVVVAGITATYTVTCTAPAEVVASYIINGEETEFYKGDDINLVDAGTTALVIPADIDNVNVTYTRDFTGTSGYQAWYVPFETTVTNDITFAKILQMAYVNDRGKIVAEAADGVLAIIVSKMNTGDVVKANVPYVVKPTTREAITFEATGLKKTKETSFVINTSTTKFTFTGSYKRYEGDTGWFYLNKSGSYSKATKLTTGVNAYRWHINTESTDLYGGDSNSPAEIRMFVLGEDEEATSIMQQITQQSSSLEGLYDITGR